MEDLLQEVMTKFTAQIHVYPEGVVRLKNEEGVIRTIKLKGTIAATNDIFDLTSKGIQIRTKDNPQRTRYGVSLLNAAWQFANKGETTTNVIIISDDYKSNEKGQWFLDFQDLCYCEKCLALQWNGEVEKLSADEPHQHGWQKLGYNEWAEYWSRVKKAQHGSEVF